MVITKNVHPVIVSEEEYELAKAMIMFMNKPGYRGTREIQHEKITQELVDATIDTVYVYDKNG